MPGLDKYYTKPEIAKMCVELWEKTVQPNINDLIVEPSAGNGVFLQYLTKYKNVMAFDIEPEGDNIIKQDYLNFNFNSSTNRIHIIGNPPFSQDIKFINHSATFADTISFILPVKFNRPKIQDKVDLNFHLQLAEHLPFLSYTYNGNSKAVNTTFQVWTKQPIKREIQYKKLQPKNFKFVLKEDNPDLVIPVKSRILKILKEDIETQLKYPKKVYFYIKLNNLNNIDKVINYTKEIWTREESHKLWMIPTLQRNDVVEILDPLLENNNI